MTHEIRTNEIKTDETRDETLRKAVESLPREATPERDLWPGIAAQIAPHRHRLQPWSVAAGISCLFAVGAILAALSLHRQQAPTTLATPQPTRQSQPVAAAPPPDERTRMLAAAIRRSTHQDPLTEAVLLKNLDLVETSINNIQQALSEDPGNPGLQPLLYQQYRDEATLVAAAQRVQLQTATGVPAP
ncbi:MAG TPA: hypothetical protein VJ862_04070 [Rhodanobacteraceae bacterium]|nr:hypothetical protein [Rhodanobacteraceae bacterium]